MVRLEIVSCEASLPAFLLNQFVPILENLELPYLRYSFTSEESDWREIADEISAWKLCREAREASLQLGSRRLQTLRKSFAHPEFDALANQKIPLHHLLVYGVQMAVLKVPLEAALTAYFYQALAGICSAALKLIRIGQEAVQRVLRTGLEKCADAVRESMKIERANAGWFNPVLEIASMRHELAEERLFIS